MTIIYHRERAFSGNMKTADPVLLLHFTDFEDADQFKQKRTQCNYCTTTLARKNVSTVLPSTRLILNRCEAWNSSRAGQRVSILSY